MARPTTTMTTPATMLPTELKSPVYQVIPQATVKDEIAGSLQKSVGQRPDAVECPGDLSAQQGESIRCVLHAGADRLGVTATVTSASIQDGDLDYKLDVKVDG